jgi:hypothetical protein
VFERTQVVVRAVPMPARKRGKVIIGDWPGVAAAVSKGRFDPMIHPGRVRVSNHIESKSKRIESNSNHPSFPPPPSQVAAAARLLPRTPRTPPRTAPTRLRTAPTPRQMASRRRATRSTACWARLVRHHHHHHHHGLAARSIACSARLVRDWPVRLQARAGLASLLDCRVIGQCSPWAK